MAQLNPYLPDLATVIDIIEETPNIKSFRVIFNDPEKMSRFPFEPGQVGQLSVFGVGESTFVINSPPTRMEYLQFSVMKAGEVTSGDPRALRGRPDRPAGAPGQLLSLTRT